MALLATIVLEQHQCQTATTRSNCPIVGRSSHAIPRLRSCVSLSFDLHVYHLNNRQERVVSAHPPVAGQDVAKLIEFAGATSLTLTFDARSCTDPTVAWCTVYSDATRSVTYGELT
jgi:hypothetical protein